MKAIKILAVIFCVFVMAATIYDLSRLPEITGVQVGLADIDLSFGAGLAIAFAVEFFIRVVKND